MLYEGKRGNKMRKIKFRGKDIDNNWVYGDLLHGVGTEKNKFFILPIRENLSYIPNCHPLNGVEVDPNTICQLIYGTDPDVGDVYEGDILKLTDDNGLTWVTNVYIGGVISIHGREYYCTNLEYILYNIEYEIIGNIYDN